MQQEKKYFDIYFPKKDQKEEVFFLKKKPLSSKNKILWVSFSLFLLVAFWFIFVIFQIEIIKKEVLTKTEKGYIAIENAQKAFPENLKEVSLNFQEAEKNFDSALKEVKKAKFLLFPFSFFSSSLKDGENFLKGAILFSRAQNNLFSLYQTSSLVALDKDNFSQKAEMLFAQKEKLLGGFERSFLMFKSGKFLWQSVSEKSIPSSYREKFVQIKEEIENIDSLFSLGNEIVNVLPSLLGEKEKKNYLILLENNNELRPGGGFIGTYGLVSFEKGRVNNFFLKGVSFFDYQYRSDLKPPYPLSTFVSRFKFMDSNVFPDFPSSARLAESFYEKFTGEKIDGVLAFTPTFIKDILKITGPISLPEYNMEVTADNFFETIQWEVEAGKDKQQYEDPKQVVYLLAERVLEKIFNDLDASQYLQIAQAVLENLSQKQILLYFDDPQVQKIAEKWNFAGRIKEKEVEGKDYLMIVNWNLGGLKSSLFVKQKVNHKIFIKENGEIEEELVIKRRHTSDYLYPYIDNFTKAHLWLVGVNRNYTKIYLPAGTKIIETQNVEKMDYFSEFGKTVVGFWFTVAPLEEKEIKIKYVLPFKIENLPSSYHLVIQKQPGDEGYDYLAEIESQKGNWFLSNLFKLSGEERKISFEDYINADKEFRFGLR